MKHLYFSIILLAFLSCNQKSNEKDLSKKDLVEYVDGRQLLTLNNLSRDGSAFDSPEIGKIKPDSVLVGEEFLARIFLVGTDLKIVNAFVDCDKVDNPSVDTATYKVSGCKTRLIVKDDTVIFALRPTQAGIEISPTFTILTRDTENVLRTVDYVFAYKVAER